MPEKNYVLPLLCLTYIYAFYHSKSDEQFCPDFPKPEANYHLLGNTAC